MKKVSLLGTITLVGLLTIGLIVLSDTVSMAEIVTEHRNGVIYIYNTVAEPTTQTLISENEDPEKETITEQDQETVEEYSLRMAKEHEDGGAFYLAYCYYKDAGDYDKSMAAYSTDFESLPEITPENAYDYIHYYKSIGDWDNYVVAVRVRAERAIGKGYYLSAASYYQDIFDTEKVKEMFLLQQEKARSRLAD